MGFADEWFAGQSPLVGLIMGNDPRSQAAAAQGGQVGASLGQAVRQYLGDVLSGAYARQGLEGLTGAYQWNPQISALENARTAARDPASIAQATNIALAMAPLTIKAYHGSPYDFDNFSQEKIGTGEGAQAYGHGLYFAENEGVARSYRDALTPKSTMRDPVGNAYDLIHSYGASKELLMRQFSELAKTARDPIQAKFYADSLDAIKSGAVDNYRPAGRMYEVNINANPEDFLNWDKPLSEQPEVLSKLKEFDKLSAVPIP